MNYTQPLYVHHDSRSNTGTSKARKKSRLSYSFIVLFNCFIFSPHIFLFFYLLKKIVVFFCLYFLLLLLMYSFFMPLLCLHLLFCNILQILSSLYFRATDSHHRLQHAVIFYRSHKNCLVYQFLIIYNFSLSALFHPTTAQKIPINLHITSYRPNQQYIYIRKTKTLANVAVKHAVACQVSQMCFVRM